MISSLECVCVLAALHVVVKDPKLSPVVVITAARGTGSSSVLKVNIHGRYKKNTNHNGSFYRIGLLALVSADFCWLFKG